MPIDGRIALGIEAPQIDDPLTAQTKRLQLSDLMANQQMHQMKMQSAQRAMADDQTIADLYRKHGNNPTALVGGMAQAGLGSRIPGYQEQQAKTGKALTENDLKTYELKKKQIDDGNAGMASLLSDPALSHEKVLQFLSDRVQSGAIPQEMGAQIARSLPGDVPRLRQMLRERAIEGLDAKARLEALIPKREKITDNQTITFPDMNPLTNPEGPGSVKLLPEAKDGFYMGPDGQPRMYPGVLDAKSKIAQAGKTAVNLNVNTAKNLTGTMAEGLGKNLDASLSGAQAAVNTITTAQQIKQLVGDGKVITGPMADKRVLLSRIGQTLGITGKDEAEVLSNTASLMQNMAKLELDASQSMKGQGQITENERGILRRAASGELNMSGPELVTLAGALDKTARARIKGHQEQVKRLGSVEGAAPMMPFYSIEEPPMPKAAGSAFNDPGKEARYQAWLKAQK